MARKGSGTGQGGKTLNDRKLAAHVRTLTLKEIKKVLEDDSDDNKEYKKQVILKLATTVLPRLNEHSGSDGQPMRLIFDPAFDPASDATSSHTTPDSP